MLEYDNLLLLLLASGNCPHRLTAIPDLLTYSSAELSGFQASTA